MVTRRLVLAGTAVLAVACGARAQDFNIDIGTFYGTPSSTYGAAAAQPGVWATPAVAGVSTPQALSNVSGASTGATLANVNAALDFNFDNLLTTGDDHALLDDLLDLGAAPASGTFVFAGLQAGNYDVYTYAFGPDGPLTFITSVVVNGLPAQAVGGADWPGSHVQGVTYAKHTVTISAGQNITVVATCTAGFGSINGFQLVKADTCYPDCNLSGGLTIADFACFQAAFASSLPYADCNQSGTHTIADFSCFQAAFAGGCP